MSQFTYSFDLYYDALDGEAVDWPLNRAMPGFYRQRKSDGSFLGIAVWLHESGRPAVKCGRAPTEVLTTPAQEAAWCERIFSWISKAPVSQESYRAWLKDGRWHDDVPAAQVDQNAEPHVVVAETIADLRRQADAWLAGIGGEVKTQEQADTAGNYADRFHELAKEAETKREAEKRPILNAGRECDQRWNVIRDAGRDAKKWAASLTDAFLKAERARKLADAAQAAAEGRPVRDADVKVRAGTRGRSTTLRKHEEPKVDDYDALFAHFVGDTRFIRHPQVAIALGQLAKLEIAAGRDVPGFRMIIVESAA